MTETVLYSRTYIESFICFKLTSEKKIVVIVLEMKDSAFVRFHFEVNCTNLCSVSIRRKLKRKKNEKPREKIEEKPNDKYTRTSKYIQPRISISYLRVIRKSNKKGKKPNSAQSKFKVLSTQR